MKRAYVNYILALVLFGSNGVAASGIHLTSYEIVLLRSALGSALLIALYVLSRREWTVLRHRRDLAYIALSGVAMALDWLLLFEAYRQIGVSLSVLINYCGPILVVALSVPLFHERLTWQKGLALGLALAGVFLISGQAALGGANAWGLFCAGASALAYTALVIFNKLSGKVGGMENAVVQLFFAALATALFVGCRQGLSMEIAPGDWPSILWIGLLNTGAGCYFYFSSIGRLPVQTVAICGYLEPLSAMLFSAVFLHETLLPLQIAGAALIMGGALMSEGIFSEKGAPA